MNAMQLTINGILLLGLLSGLAPIALGCSTNPCDQDKLAPDPVNSLAECSGSQCHEIVFDPIEATASCDGGNCSDARLLPDLSARGKKQTRAMYSVECSGDKC